MLEPSLHERLNAQLCNNEKVVKAVKQSLWKRNAGMTGEGMRLLMLKQNEHLFVKKVNKELLRLYGQQVSDSDGEGSRVDGEHRTPRHHGFRIQHSK